MNLKEEILQRMDLTFDNIVISYDNAIKLKEVVEKLSLSFKVWTCDNYLGEGKNKGKLGWSSDCKINIPAPDAELVCQWLRLKHQIYIEIKVDRTAEPKFCFSLNRFIGNPKDLTEKEWYWMEGIDYKYDSELYMTYELALQAAINKSLNILLKDEKDN